jgi:hypothetical protein
MFYLLFLLGVFRGLKTIQQLFFYFLLRMRPAGMQLKERKEKDLFTKTRKEKINNSTRTSIYSTLLFKRGLYSLSKESESSIDLFKEISFVFLRRNERTTLIAVMVVLDHSIVHREIELRSCVLSLGVQRANEFLHFVRSRSSRRGNFTCITNTKQKINRGSVNKCCKLQKIFNI